MVEDSDNDQELEPNDELGEEPELEPGHHVFVDGAHLAGPYPSTEDAQAYIDGHLKPQGTDGEIRLVA